LKICFLISLIILSFFLPACRRSPRRKYTPKVSKTNNTSNSKYYIVRSGDSLWKISSSSGYSIKDLAAFNGISVSTPLKVGQKLYYPPKDHSKINRNSSTHKTKVHTKNKIRISKTFLWPAKGKVIVKFGEKHNGISSKGIDISLPVLSPFKASKEGEIIFSSPMNDYGIVTIIKHNDGYYSLYYSFSKKSLVKKGQKISKGTVIGYAGKKSISDKKATLHFEIRRREKALNPLYLLKSQ